MSDELFVAGHEVGRRLDGLPRLGIDEPGLALMHNASHDPWLLEDLQPDGSLVEVAAIGMFIDEVSSRRALV
eukprot:5461221-Heterocapsa_arctica.AAC.1